MRSRFAGGVAAGAVLACLLCASGAWAETAAPWFTIESSSAPTVFSAAFNGGSAPNEYVLTVTNAGSVATDGSPITVADTLPTGLTATNVRATAEPESTPSCTLVGVSCTYEGALQPGAVLRVFIEVEVASGISGTVTNSASVSGGGAPVATISRQTTIGTEAQSLAEPFGLENFTERVAGADGQNDTQAGDHPYEFTIDFNLNTVAKAPDSRFSYVVAGGGNKEAEVKDFVVDTPPGFLGNPEVIGKCPQHLVPLHECPDADQIGVIRIFEVPGVARVSKIYNVVPDKGFPAEFEFTLGEFRVAAAMYVTVDPDTNYGVRVTVPDIPGTASTHGAEVTFFGTPLTDANFLNVNPGLGLGALPFAFLENPTGCSSEPQMSSVSADSWQQPGAVLPDGAPDLGGANWKTLTVPMFPQITGCERVQFNPSLSVLPETSRADEPTGVKVDLGIPQAPLRAPDLGSAEVQDATVALPAGLSISPSAADGLQSCSDTQIALSSGALGSCPLASEIGTVKVFTPLLAVPLEGQVFLGTPRCAPCSNTDAEDGNMVRVFLQLQGSGVVVKQEGTVHVNASTGQLTATFTNTPQLPFSDLQFQFKGGLRAALATPQSCGTFTAASEITPWGAPVTPIATPAASFGVDWDGAGGACPASAPFNPAFSAGTSNPDAGQLSPLTVTFAREDREQDLAGIQIVTPPGLLGSLASVPLCGEPQAAQGTCGVESKIGLMTVAAGAGSHPFYTQGALYLTGPYKGAPFGLSIVVPTVAGPFNLGNVVVRAQIAVDPHTAALTVTSDPFPQIIDGIPLRLRVANVTVDRPGFIFNPTNCAQQAITATITSAQGTQAHASAPFAVSGCAGLAFKPKLSASTSSKDRFNVNGASLTVRVATDQGPSASSGTATEANIAQVKVELPKSLPSRLTTLQKACTAAQFNANPAGCPAASLIGHATVHTPLLPVPLEGPAIFVSHGGEAFPNLILVLQGYGVTIDLVGDTFISKAGITSSTFKTVPDQPFSTFELTLPTGKYSALAATTKVCKPTKRETVRKRVLVRVHGKLRKVTERVTKTVAAPLVMPTEITAQNGAVLRQNTKIAVEGCPKAKKRATKRAAKHG
jgi:Domain of unknown function DUF11